MSQGPQSFGIKVSVATKVAFCPFLQVTLPNYARQPVAGDRAFGFAGFDHKFGETALQRFGAGHVF